MKRILSVLIAAALVLAFAACGNPAGGGQDRYGVSVSVNGSSVNATAGLVFTAAGEGYGAVEPFTVTVTNTGNQATGGLTASLSGGAASSFTITGGTIAGIPAGGTATFTVGPNTGLTAEDENTAKTYTATVTVSGGNNIAVNFPVSFTVNARPPDYGIALSKTGTHTFTGVNEGYAAVSSLEVTVTNTGANATGELTVALSGTDEGSFTLSANSLESIPAGTGTATFTIGPNMGLTPEDENTAKTYTATVTVSGGNGITASFTVSFTVSPEGIDPPPVYGIELDKDENAVYTWPEVDAGYPALEPMTVTVTNTGNQATGELTAELSGTDEGSFTLSGSPIASIPAGGTATFTIGPNTGLTPEDENTAKTYTATVTVSGGNGITASFTVRFTVAPEGIDPDPDYGISLDKTGTHTFDSAPIGYTAITPLTVTVTNTGNQATGELTAELSGTNPGSFTLSKTSIGSIGTDGSDTFTVGPNDNLPVGTYEATITVSGGSGIAPRSFDLIFTVMMEPFTTTDAVVVYLAQVQGGNTPDDPVPLPVILGTGDWPALLSAIQTAEKYVALDLSVGAMVSTEFDPGAANTGEDRIVSLTLPDTAITVKAGSQKNPTFQYFTALKSVSGKGIKTIGDWAFDGCASLTTLTLPAAKDIGICAFSGCTGLTTLDLPAAVTIGDSAFYACRLTTVDFPAAVTIGDNAFEHGTNLTTVDLPKATTIGIAAFSGCTKLETIILTAAVTIKQEAFSYCSSLTTITLPKATTIGITAFSDCTKLETISLPVAVTIPDWAFQRCTSLKTITAPKAETIGADAFLNCTSLTTPTLTAAKDIGVQAFYGCTSLETISLPEAKDIGVQAFYGCTSLETISLPEAETISDKAFWRCNKLTTLTLTAAETIGLQAFDGCISLTALTLPAAVTIGNSAFWDCTNLTTLTLPAATTIESFAFGGCTSLATVSLGAKAPRLGHNMFNNVNVTNTVTVKVPLNVTGYGDTTKTYSDEDDTPAWGNGFRGGGWNGSAFTNSFAINSNITLTIQHEGSE